MEFGSPFSVTELNSNIQKNVLALQFTTQQVFASYTVFNNSIYKEKTRQQIKGI